MNSDANQVTVCILCGRTHPDAQFNREHIIPQSVGGTLYMDDVVCTGCNSRLGAQVDSELLKLPDVLAALEALDIPHNRDGIINRHYSISGSADDVELLFGRKSGNAVSFPGQRLQDGSLVTPEHEGFAPIERTVRRDKRLRETGASEQEITERLEELRTLYEEAQPGVMVQYPSLGIAFRKRSDKLSIDIVPRSQANVLPLIAKIAYEMLFFYGGPAFLSKENEELRRELLIYVDSLGTDGKLFVMRSEAAIQEYQPVHLVRVKFSPVTIVRVAFFGHIEYVLTAKPLDSGYSQFLAEKLGIAEILALDYQQGLDSSIKSFWAINEKGEPVLLAAT